MATVTIDTVVAKTATLTAAAADTVNVTCRFRRIDITNLDATGQLSVAFQSGAATVDGDGTRPVPPGTTRTIYDDADIGAVSVSADDFDVSISVISSTACKYCVEVF